MSIRVIDLFAGIGGIRLGFEAHGCECVFSSEWDADAQKMYAANHGHQPDGDITQIAPEDIPTHDILLAGFPCQPFSIIGKSLGFADTRGTLFFNIEEILRVKQPYAFMLENVKQLMEKISKSYSKPSVWHENKGGNISALPYSCALRAGASYNYLLVNGERRLTSRKMLRLQGFPEAFRFCLCKVYNINNSPFWKLIIHEFRKIKSCLNLLTDDLWI